jgi:dienelactone hydrolase
MMKKFPRETLDARAQRLLPFCQIVRPEGQGPFPTVFLFHGCGDPDGPQPGYAKAAAAKGIASVVVDSYRPRGISLIEARMLICSGMRLWGRERAGDLISLMHWARNQDWVAADRLAAAGWSHGGWTVMDALALGAEVAEFADLEGVSADPLAGLTAAFLVYPWCGLGAQTLRRGWQKAIPAFLMLGENDTLSGTKYPLRAADKVRGAGAPVETHIYPGATHSFDEETSVNPTFRFNPVQAADAQARFADWMASRLL